jgi:hypothetical protein
MHLNSGESWHSCLGTCHVPAIMYVMASDLSPLLAAIRNVAEARRIVARQRERIAYLKLSGCSALDNEQTLAIFQGTLATLESHARNLRNQAATKEAKERR